MKKLLTLTLALAGLALPTTAAARPFELRPGERLDAPPTLQVPVAYQWLRCDRHGHRCRSIAGATHRIYTMRQADVGDRLKVRMTFRCGRRLTSAPSYVVFPR